MARYGFKLLKIQLYEGNGRKPQAFVSSDGSRYIDLVHADIQRAIEAQSNGRTGETFTVSTAEGETVEIAQSDVVDSPEVGTLPANASSKPPAVIRFDRADLLRSALLLDLQYGVVGDHQWALDPSGERAAADLSGLATTREYRALLIAPASAKVGMLAVEVISRSHAGADLPRRLRNAQNGHFLTIRAKGPIADVGAVSTLMRDGRVTEVELLKDLVTTDTVHSRVKKVRLKFPITVGTSEATRILDIVRSWLPRRDATKELIAAEEAANLASILWSDAAQLAFDDARVEVKSDIANRRLAPLDRTEGFVYEIGDHQVDDEEFVRRVASVAQSLFVAEGMDMEPDWAQNDS